MSIAYLFRPPDAGVDPVSWESAKGRSDSAPSTNRVRRPSSFAPASLAWFFLWRDPAAVRPSDWSRLPRGGLVTGQRL